MYLQQRHHFQSFQAYPFVHPQKPQFSHHRASYTLNRSVICQSLRPSGVSPASKNGGPVVEESSIQEAASSKFDWSAQWYPIAWIKDVEPKKPYAFTLLENPIVIWVDNDMEYHAFRDACPHRLVPLSEGRIGADGHLECPYHGWKFNGTGTCVCMPQGGEMNSHRSSAISYQCALRQGLVWVKLKPPIPGFSTADIHIIPELDTVEWVPFGDMHRDVPYDFINLLENVIDPGHVSFTHAGSVSTRDSSGTFDDMGIVSTDAGGFKGKWIKGPRKGKLGSLFTEFKATMMRHTLESKWGFANITAVYGVPTSPGRCRAFVRQPLRLKNNVLPKALLKWLPLWLGHIGANSVLDEDNIFLHHQEVEAVKRGIGNKPVGQVFYLSGSCDAYVIAFRKWLTDMAGGGPFGQQTQQWLDRKEGLRLSRDELLDHYHSHTATCLECQRGLAFMKAVKNGVGIIGLASFVVAVTSWTMQAQGLAQTNNVLQGSAVISVISVVVWQMCVNTVGAFYKGSYPPRRNMVSGEWKP